MPWEIANRGGKFVVTKKGGGRVVGTHGRIEDAKAQLRALYAKESAPKPAASNSGANKVTGRARALSNPGASKRSGRAAGVLKKHRPAMKKYAKKRRAA